MADDHDHVLHATTPPPLLRQTAAIDVTPPAPRPLDLVPSTQWALAPLAVLRAAPPTQSLTFLRSTVLLV